MLTTHRCTGDGTIDSVEYAAYIKGLFKSGIKEPKDSHFECAFPHTFTISEGQLTNWWAPTGENGVTFKGRALPDRPWEGVAAVMRQNWRQLPPTAQYTKRGEVDNFAVQWTSDRGADGEVEFRSQVLTESAFHKLSKMSASVMKSTVAIQAFVWSKTPGAMYKVFYTGACKGRAPSAHVMLYRRIGMADAGIEASTSADTRDHAPPVCYKKVPSLTRCAQTVGTRMQSLTRKLVRVFESAEGRRVVKCESSLSLELSFVHVRRHRVSPLLTTTRRQV